MSRIASFGPPELPALATVEGALAAISSYAVTRMKRNVAETIHGQLASLVVLAEHHWVADHAKALLMADLVRRHASTRPKTFFFVASEGLFDDHPTRAAMTAFASAKTSAELAAAGQLVPAKNQPYVPVFTAAAKAPGGRCIVVPAGSHEKIADRRHAAIEATFRDGLLSAAKTRLNSSNSRGLFLLGAAHAAWAPPWGALPTTTRLLSNAGWTIHTVRVTTSIPSWTSSPADDLRVQLIAGSDRRTVDLLTVFDKLAGKSPFYLDLWGDRGVDSPFAQLRLPEPSRAVRAVFTGDYAALADAHATPINTLYNAVLHFPQ